MDVATLSQAPSAVPRAARVPAHALAAARAYAALVRAEFGARVSGAWLFGSMARGEAHEDSDVDVLFVVEGLTPEERRDIDHRAGDVALEHDVVFGGFTTSLEHWEELRARERAIVAEVERDGVPL